MPESAKPRIAVIGLGSMGFGMATSLRRAGFDVTGCDVSADASRGSSPTAARAPRRRRRRRRMPTSSSAWSSTPRRPKPFCSAPTASPKRWPRTRCSFRPRPWTRTWRGGWQSNWRPPAGIISTRRSPAARSARRRANSLFWPRAVPAAFAKARPALDAMAAKLYELGDAAGQGAAFKMINQLLAGVHIAAASEAITFAAKQGLDIRKVYEVITASAGNSWMFENRMPHVLDGDYTPRSAVEIFVKDLGIIQDMARTARFPGAGRGRRAADVPDDGGRRHGPRRRRVGGADVCQGHRHAICRASRSS